jgi:signal peptidase I
MDADFQIVRSATIPSAQPLTDSLNSTRRKTPPWLKQIVQAVTAAVLAILSYYLISHYLVQSVQVVGSSMSPTLHDSEHYLLNRWVFHFRNPQRGDIVVIRDPEAHCYSVKRIVGLPGDSIELRATDLHDSRVYINNQKLNEPYLSSNISTWPIGTNTAELVLEGNKFYVLGDNRGNSADSRIYRGVARDNIIGLLVR